MASLNKVMLIGNLTRDPEVRYTPKGSAVCDLALAVNRSFTADNGEKREEVTYVDIVVWAKLAEIAGKYLQKGAPVFVEGRLQMDQWDDKQTGVKRTKIRVVAENFQFLGKREGVGAAGSVDEEGGGARPAPRPAQKSQTSRQEQPASEFSEGPITDGLEDDDIPF